MNIGTAIKNYRKSNNQTQLEAATALGITNAYLSRIESGKLRPSPDLIERISEYTGTPLAVILWKALEETDVPEQKRDAFRVLKPSVDALIDQLF